jgi:uncharacterized protein
MTTRLSNRWLEVIEGPDGSFHVMATRDIAPGEVVCRLPKVFSDTRDRHSIEVGPGRHQAYTDDIDDYINHSCDPNLELIMVDADADDYVFRAKRAVAEGEEVTWDYETFETALSNPFPCTCGSVNCRGTIVGRYLR